MNMLVVLMERFWWVLGMAAVGFFGTLLLVPVVVCRLPEDYFVSEEPPIREWTWKHIAMQFVRNVIGVILILAGLVMLIAPGQGVLTILIGIACLNFRGKRHLMRWFLFRPGVLKGLNWIRSRGNVPPFRHEADPLRLPHSSSV